MKANTGRIVTYSANDLKAFRFSRRRDRIELCTYQVLIGLSIFRHFHPARGSRGGKIHTKVIQSRIGVRISEVRSVRVIGSRCSDFNNITAVRRSPTYQIPKIFYTNIRSIYNKFDDLEAYIVIEKPQVIVLTETWIKPDDRDAFELPNFTSFHYVRSGLGKTRGGGVSVYIDKSFSIFSVKVSESDLVESVTVVFRSNYLPREVPVFAVNAIYFPPLSGDAQLYADYVSSEIDRILTSNSSSSLFIIGDFNDLDIGSIGGINLFRQLVMMPTRKDNVLDKCYYRGPLDYKSIVSSPISSSDHNVVKVFCDVGSFPAHDVKSFYCRPKTSSNYRAFGQSVSSLEWDSLYSLKDIDSASRFFNETIKNIYERSFPLKLKSVRLNDKSWLTDEIRNLVREKNYAFGRQDVVQIGVLSRKIKECVHKAKIKEHRRMSEDIRFGTKNFYDLIKYSTGYKCKRDLIEFPGRSSLQTTREIFDHFNALANSLDPLLDSFCDFEPAVRDVPLVDQLWVLSQLRSVSASTATAPDGIPNFILKEFAMELYIPVSYLLNLSLDQCRIPDIWKSAYLIPIPKSKAPKGPGEIRPISILPSIAKIYERHILGLISDKVGSVIDINQYGVFPGKSTTDYLAFYSDSVLGILDVPCRKAVSVITDFNKAYDSVNHRVFMSALCNLDISLYLVRWFDSYLRGRIQMVKVPGSCLTLDYSCSNGVPQGSVLGGLIFVLTTNKIAIDLEKRFKYIDDITVVVSGSSSGIESEAQKCVDLLSKDATACSMSINPTKSCLLVHDFSRKKSDVNIFISGSSLQIRSSCRILGLTIQDNFKWDIHIGNIIRSTNKKFFLLYKLKRLNLDVITLKNIYITFIRPNTEYCSPIWSNAITKAQSHLLEMVQRRATRIILGKDFVSYSRALVVLGLPTLVERRSTLFGNYASSFIRRYGRFLPVRNGEVSNHETRGRNKLFKSFIRTKRYESSVIPCVIRFANNGST